MANKRVYGWPELLVGKGAQIQKKEIQGQILTTEKLKVGRYGEPWHPMPHSFPYASLWSLISKPSSTGSRLKTRPFRFSSFHLFDSQ